MPHIFDNIEQRLLPALKTSLESAIRADFCVGYFNLRGWKAIDSHIECWGGDAEGCCRLLVGMQRLPQEELQEALTFIRKDEGMDNQTALRLKKKLAEEFRNQLTIGVPTNDDEAGLRRLAGQIKSKKVVVKLFLRHPLHAKLYLLFRADRLYPMLGYLGSSNLTFSGLSKQGELNIDVPDQDTCHKLAKWFEDRWNDRWCIDISNELVDIIEESWAREDLIPPYHIYVKMAYHLSQEARAGLAAFRIPREFSKLFDFQKAAVKIAAHYLNKRGGVLIGDVVGLGKTLMATALARIFEEDFGLSTLIICPKNLVKMWQSYVDQYGLRAKVLSLSRVIHELPNVPARFRLVLIDESHNLRNREGRRYRAIQEYIAQYEGIKCILLSATPYNKTYLDLSNQLRLFVPEDKDLGIRPEQLLRQIGETEFLSRYQAPVRSIAAFEKSEFADDWRELMRLYMVRRTRSFIQDNYAEIDPDTNRRYLLLEDGSRSYFPQRIPKTVKFKISDDVTTDPYARLYDDGVVEIINKLNLPRYGLGNYVAAAPKQPPNPSETRFLQDLSRAGKRLMGFCRTNLFKRLESSGQAFLQSIERHILRNYVFLHAIENGDPLPIGTQDAAMLDTRTYDADADAMAATADLFSDEDTDDGDTKTTETNHLLTEEDFQRRAAEGYAHYQTEYRNRFKWVRSDLFLQALEKDLRNDARALLQVLQTSGDWQAAADDKLQTLIRLLARKHAKEKALIFTQFADTVRYLESSLKRYFTAVSGVCGDSADPTGLAWRFSPVSNNKRSEIKPEDELRILIATDILSEGQNLQDCSIVINYDLPWAIIRLIQRAGRVDRIGQQSEKILCYSFLPAQGVDKIIRLRERVRQRLTQNAEVVGADEAFFEDDKDSRIIIDLYNEKAGILDGDADTEVDLASYAYQIWKNAIDDNPALKKAIESLPSVVFSTRSFAATKQEPEGALIYLRTAQGNDALAWIDRDGNSVTESQFAILKAAECLPDTDAIPRYEKHHELVKRGVELIAEEERSVGGQLGKRTGARYRTYERLKGYAEESKGTLFESPELLKALDEIYRYPLRQTAADILNRQLKSGIADNRLAELVIALRDEDRLSLIHEEEQSQEPHIICSLGLMNPVSG